MTPEETITLDEIKRARELLEVVKSWHAENDTIFDAHGDAVVVGCGTTEEGRGVVTLILGIARALGSALDALEAAQLRASIAEARLKVDAERLADEVDVLVARKVIDMRSPAADALLDFRDRSPRTERSDRLAELERALEAEQAKVATAGEGLMRHAVERDEARRRAEKAEAAATRELARADALERALADKEGHHAALAIRLADERNAAIDRAEQSEALATELGHRLEEATRERDEARATPRPGWREDALASNVAGRLAEARATIAAWEPTIKAMLTLSEGLDANIEHVSGSWAFLEVIRAARAISLERRPLSWVGASEDRRFARERDEYGDFGRCRGYDVPTGGPDKGCAVLCCSSATRKDGLCDEHRAGAKAKP